MKLKILFAGYIALAISGGTAAAQTPSAPQRTVDITVPADITDSDRQRISDNVNRFFKLVPPISIGGQITTPIGGGGVIINVGRAGAAPAAATGADVAQFANTTIDDYARNIFKEIACNAAAAAAAAACSGSGPVLAACLAVVEASRRACLR